MITTVSDILLYQKCPLAWWVKNVARKEPMNGGLSAAFATGTEFHQAMQAYHAIISVEQPTQQVAIELLSKYPLLANLPVYDKTILWNIVKKIKHAEYALEIEINGHTIHARPDGIAPADKCLVQYKTVSAKKLHYMDIVRISVHENIYALGCEQHFGSEFSYTLPIFYKKSKTGNPTVYSGGLTPLSKKTKLAATNFVTRICNEMEHLANATQKEAENWESPPACIDWITGTKCPCYHFCHIDRRKTDLLGGSVPAWQWKEVETRYPEFAVAGTGGQDSTQGTDTDEAN